MPIHNDHKFSTDMARRFITEQMDWLVEQAIREGKVTEPNWWVTQRGRVLLFVIVLALCALAGGAYQWWLLHPNYAKAVNNPLLLPNSASFTTVLISVAAAFFAYYQWTDGRREASLDKFYDRLKIVNERYFEWKEARDLVSHFWRPTSEDADFRKAMYVFLELDNLEYMIIRFKLGYVRKPLLQRAIRTFLSRCQSQAFCDLAVLLVSGSGYIQETVDVTNMLAFYGKTLRSSN